jgi:hypothetical protein
MASKHHERYTKQDECQIMIQISMTAYLDFSIVTNHSDRGFHVHGFLLGIHT